MKMRVSKLFMVETSTYPFYVAAMDIVDATQKANVLVSKFYSVYNGAVIGVVAAVEKRLLELNLDDDD